MACEFSRTLLAVLVAGGVACAKVDDPVASAPKDAGGDLPDPLRCHVKDPMDLGAQDADVLILLDRSGSMDTVLGSGTRYEVVTELLYEQMHTFDAFIRFGYQEMPGRQECDSWKVNGCCASAPLVGVADNNEQPVKAALASALPMDGNTPTAASLQQARHYFETLDDGVANRYVVLATDGAPNCTLDGLLSNQEDFSASGPACSDALSEVSKLVALGVQVLVLAVGPGLPDDLGGGATCLNALAHAGGAATSPGNPGFFVVSNPGDSLGAAMARMFTGALRPACRLNFARPVADTDDIAVYFDGQKIPSGGPNGWKLDTSPTSMSIVVTGTYCEQIQQFQVGSVVVRGCSPCVDLQGC